MVGDMVYSAVKGRMEGEGWIERGREERCGRAYR